MSYSPLASEVERRQSYIAASMRVANRQKPTLIKLAAMFQLNSQESGTSIEDSVEAYNALPHVQGTKLEINRSALYVPALATLCEAAPRST